MSAPIHDEVIGVWPDGSVAPFSPPSFSVSLVAGSNCRIRLKVKTGATWGAAKNVAGCVAMLRIGNGRLGRLGTVVDGPNGLIDLEMAQVDTLLWAAFGYPAIISLTDPEGMRENITSIGLVNIIRTQGTFDDPVDTLSPTAIVAYGVPAFRNGYVDFDGSTIELPVTFASPMPTANYTVLITGATGVGGGTAPAAPKSGTLTMAGLTIQLTTADFIGRVYWRVDALP